MDINRNFFVDPDCFEPLNLEENDLVAINGVRYPIINDIPRFVDNENYASAFGFQWNRFSQTQLDSHTGLDLSKSRLSRCMGGHLALVTGQLVLEAGSGAGRFTEILLENGAIVHSFDYSNAVEANAKNNQNRLNQENLILAQADISRIPFKRDFYDYVICLGVLQHTPDPDKSITNLYKHVKPGGYLIIDHYRFSLFQILCAFQLYRQIIKNISKRTQFKIVKKIVDFWFPIHWKFKDFLWIQRLLRRISPVFFYYPHLGLPDKESYYEWALLDTHDGTTDVYKHHRTVTTIHKTLQNLGAQEIKVSIVNGGTLIEAICRKGTGSVI